MNRKIIFAFMLPMILSFTSNAHALTIGGREYFELLSGNVNGKVGLWYAMGKGYSFGVFGDVARWTQTQITSTTFESEALDGAQDAGLFSFEFMKAAPGPNGALTATDIRVLSSTGNLLLSLQLDGNGSVSTIPALGAAGDFTLTGLFRAVGGQWLTEGFVRSDFYASINYSNGIISNRDDFHANGGSFRLYSCDVPEPASAALLGLGMVGASMRKRRRAVKI